MRTAIVLVVGLLITGAGAELPRPEDLPLTVTVGPDSGDIRGADDKALQAGLDYLARMGGGVLKILPGEYTMHNALHMQAGITVRGSGRETVLKKAPSVRSALVQDADWYERQIRVADPAGFRVWGGVMVQSKRSPSGGFQSLQMTVVRIDGNVLTLNGRLNKNFWLKHEASAATLYPLIRAERVDDVRVEHLVLDGNREANEAINGNYAGAIFMQWCDRVRINGVICQNYNGDGISLQVCDDAEVVNTVSRNNANLGLHPGSGCQRPVFRNCRSTGNAQGFFFCWGVMGGLVEDCLFAENGDYGVSFGHRDTDNIVRNCRILRNGKVGVLFRKEETLFFGGHRNLLEGCEILDNGAAAEGVGVDIRGETQDITIRACRIGDTGAGGQKVGVRIGEKASGIVLEENEYFGMETKVEDL